ncbi:MAG: adenylate kinase [Pyrinomonadaceae bacterium]|nr:adenylate kinase [Pyrinomonadaceae bacterium]
MSKIIVLIGAPGAGKGTQARLLEAKLQIPQISTGDMFREIQNSDTALAREVKEILASGKLVPDNVTFEMVKERTSREDCGGSYILDGFPRTPRQAEMLEELASDQGKVISTILIDVPFEKLEERLTGRRSCPECGEIYNIHYKKPKVDGFCDDHPQAMLKHRADDTEDKVKVRLETYEENTKPLLKYYEDSGRLQKVDGTRRPDEIYRELENLIATNNVTA